MKTIFIIFSGLLCLCINTQAQNIATYAGGGSALVDGIPATNSSLNPTALGAFDALGNFYFADGMGKIRSVNATGEIHTVAGTGITGFFGDGGPATSAQLHFQGFAVDALGNIYIGDYYNNRIRKVDVSTHIIATIAGNGTASVSGEGGPATAAEVMPSGICLDPIGNIYFVDGGGYYVRKISTSGIITKIAGNGIGGIGGDGGPASTAQLAMNGSLCMNADGDLFLACDARIRKIEMATGIISTFAGNGTYTYIGEGMPATSAQFDSYVVNADTTINAIYIADLGNDRVYQIDATGIFHLIAGNGTAGFGGDGSSATSAKLYNPQGVVTDACGNLYIADDANRRIRKVTFSTTSIASISISVLPNDTVCAGTPVTYTATLTDSSTSGYQWYKNGTAIIGATSRTYTYTPTESGDDVHCVYTGIDICSFSGTPSSNVVHMVVRPLTAPTIAVTGPASMPIGSTVTVNATVSGAGGSYSIKWYRNSVLFNTTTVPTTTYTKTAGADIITAKVSSTDATGCYDTTTSAGHTVNVGPNGVDEVREHASGVSIYPNPAKQTITISADGGLLKSISISNLLGREVVSKVCSSVSEDIAIGHLSPGVYMVRVNGEYVSRVVRE